MFTDDKQSHVEGAEAQLRDRCKKLQDRLAAQSEELTRVRQQLAEARVRLREQAPLVSLGRLSAGVAHELKNPANFVYGGAIALTEQIEALAESSPAAEKLLKLATIVKTGGERIKHLTDTLDTYRGRGSDDRRQFELTEAIGSTLTLLGPQAKRRGVSFEVDAPEHLVLVGRYGELCQVLTNLVVNAVQASPQGGRVVIRASGDEAAVAITVSDQGEGIDPAVLDWIFEPFFTTKPVDEGTGLGLTISQAIVERQGGRIEVESAPGKGARFTMTIPTRLEGEQGGG